MEETVIKRYICPWCGGNVIIHTGDGHERDVRFCIGGNPAHHDCHTKYARGGYRFNPKKLRMRRENPPGYRTIDYTNPSPREVN